MSYGDFSNLAVPFLGAFITPQGPVHARANVRARAQDLLALPVISSFGR